MPRFYFDPQKVSGSAVLLEEKESRHALRVLRLKAGDAVELLDGKGKSFSGFVVGEEAGRLRVQLNVNAVTQRTHTVPVALACAVIKPEGMEWMIEKACELGVAGIFPILSDRSVIKLTRERWAAKEKRWQKIAEEACKQCGLTLIPRIAPLKPLKDFLAEKQEYDLLLIPTLAVKTEPLGAVLKAAAAKSVLVMVGPEGDFTEKEVGQAVDRGARAVSLGPLVMRSETAALYALSALRFYYDKI